MDLKYIAIGLLALALYALSGGTGNAATTTTQSGDCLQTLQAQYAGQWAEMNTMQRAMVGLQAAGCQDGGR